MRGESAWFLRDRAIEDEMELGMELAWRELCMNRTHIETFNFTSHYDYKASDNIMRNQS